MTEGKHAVVCARGIHRPHGVRIATLDPAAAPYRAALTDPAVGVANARLELVRFFE